jgi:hypothetical protein
LLVNYEKDVIYTSISGYTGPDSFQFKVNDGGSPPTGGDSNVATVSITVQSPSPGVIYETHFDTGLPDGWTIVNGGSSTDTWRSDNPGNQTSPYWTGTFMIVDSDYAGHVNMEEQLITHSIDCTNWTDVKLKFKHDFVYAYTEVGDVDVRVNGGVWRKVAGYRRDDYSGLVELALSDFWVDGNPDVQIRWHYYNAYYDWYWGIDDVQIIASPLVPTVVVKKCNVSAGSKDNTDRISFSGTMNAGTGNILDAGAVEVTIDSNDMANPCILTFPVNETTFKKGKFRCSASNASFVFNTKTSKFSFTAKNMDLSGLGCPLTVQIEIGDYNSTAEIDETIVNGPKKPIPILLMMGVKDALRVDKCQVKHGKKPNSDRLLVRGGFAVEDVDVDMAAGDFVAELAGQTFTIPAGSFQEKGVRSTCSKVTLLEGGIAAAMFNFKTCSFTLTIKNTNITATGTVNFGIAFADYNQVEQVTLP